MGVRSLSLSLSLQRRRRRKVSLLLLLRRRRSRRAAAGVRRPETLLLLLIPGRAAAAAAAACCKPASTSDVRRRPSRVIHAHSWRTAHGRPPHPASGPRRPRRGVCLRRGASSRTGDGPGRDGLSEQELGIVVSDVGAVLEARVVLVADDRLCLSFFVFEREGREEKGLRKRRGIVD